MRFHFSRTHCRMRQVQREDSPSRHFTKFSREDFLRYLDWDYDPDDPDKYDINLACMSINVYTLDYQTMHMHTY